MRDPFDDLRSYAARLEAEVPVERARARARAAINSTPPRRRRMAVVASAAIGFMGISNVALAAVSNPAIPGDALYGIDRAYERIGELLGIGGEHRLERLNEAASVVALGDEETALSLVQEALTGLVDQDVDTARAMLSELERGADVEALHQQIQEMIDIARDTADAAGSTEMREAAERAAASGLDVAEVARTIRDTIDLPDAASQDHPGDAADGRGPPEDAGPPDHSNAPADAGPPEDAGKAGDATPPANGPPSDAGSSAGGGPPASSPSDTRPANNGNNGSAEPTP